MVSLENITKSDVSIGSTPTPDQPHKLISCFSDLPPELRNMTYQAHFDSESLDPLSFLDRSLAFVLSTMPNGKLYSGFLGKDLELANDKDLDWLFSLLQQDQHHQKINNLCSTKQASQILGRVKTMICPDCTGTSQWDLKHEDFQILLGAMPSLTQIRYHMGDVMVRHERGRVS